MCQLHISLIRAAQIYLELHFCVELHTKKSPGKFWVPICLYWLNCTKLGQLILVEIIKIVAILKGKMHLVHFRLRLDPPQTLLGELTALPQTS